MGRDPRPTAQDRRLSAVVATPERTLPEAELGGVAVEGAETIDRAVAALMLPFLLRDDGWLRIVPQDDGATVYWKWKWTAGPHRNCYVMTVYPQTQSAESLRRLALKVDAVDCGKEPPVKDHYFKG